MSSLFTRPHILIKHPQRWRLSSPLIQITQVQGIPEHGRSQALLGNVVPLQIMHHFVNRQPPRLGAHIILTYTDSAIRIPFSRGPARLFSKRPPLSTAKGNIGSEQEALRNRYIRGHTAARGPNRSHPAPPRSAGARLELQKRGTGVDEGRDRRERLRGEYGVEAAGCEARRGPGGRRQVGEDLAEDLGRQGVHFLDCGGWGLGMSHLATP